ncbi:MAG: phosphosulfolactate synthase [Bacteroidetes bacterium]|nr:MAG: phosphosulfolactate synthase [Bacteroidota bacterium]
MVHKQFNMIGIPERPAKPRPEGLTLMLDKGLSARQVEDVLDVAAEYIDLVKLGWGTAVITPGLERKLAIYRAADVPVYFGGSLFEAFYLRRQFDTYRRLLDHLGIRHVEVSDGSLEMARDEKLGCIHVLSRDFTVLSEVGSKDKDTIMPPYKWVRYIQQELEAGSWKVICEARESGTAGIFRPNGEIRSGLVDEIVDLIDRRHIIFEAPQKAQQVWFIKHSGPNVNLGNISPEEVIPLETLRLGLRADTMFDFYREDEAAPVRPHLNGDDAGGPG